MQYMMESNFKDDGQTAKPLNVKRIAIVGAGPSGLAAARYFLEENAFTTIDVYEQQPEVGGTWHYTSKITYKTPIPQTNAHLSLEHPILQPEEDDDLRFGTPMYDTLVTNIPKEVMGYHDVDFPVDCSVYPPRQAVQDYLIRYSADLRQHLHLSTQVRSVVLSTKEGVDTWHLTALNVKTKQTVTADYDAILAASGHYSVPYVPSILGLDKWTKAYPEAVLHSKYYRGPTPFLDKKVVVVGNAASGIDISLQVGNVSQTPVLCSVQTPSDFGIIGNVRLEVPPIQEFIVEERAVKFENGRVERDVDLIVFCTGYLYSFPYLDTLQPALISDGHRVSGTYKWIFNSRHPTLAFTLLPQKMLPFFTAECQVAVVARVWSNRLRLPPLEKMEAWEKIRLEEKGDGIEFHRLGFPDDGKYATELHDWASQAGRSKGKQPPVFSHKQDYIRQIIFDAKKVYIAGGQKATSLKELGFDWEESSRATKL